MPLFTPFTVRQVSDAAVTIEIDLKTKASAVDLLGELHSSSATCHTGFCTVFSRLGSRAFSMPALCSVAALHQSEPNAVLR